MTGQDFKHGLLFLSGLVRLNMERDKRNSRSGSYRESKKTTKRVSVNLKGNELQTMIRVIGERFTRKVWVISLKCKTTDDVIAGLRI